MKIEEAIIRIKEHKDIHFKKEFPHAIKITEALDMAIQALDKQIPKKFDKENDFNYCPVCGRGGNSWDKPRYCQYCGQLLKS